MSDRLAELRRQRTLVQQHLDWLDAEIARVQGPRPPPPAPDPAASVPPAPLPDPDLDLLLAAQADAPANSAAAVKRGCLIAFSVLLLLLGLAVTGLYFYSRSRH